MAKRRKNELYKSPWHQDEYEFSVLVVGFAEIFGEPHAVKTLAKKMRPESVSVEGEPGVVNGIGWLLNTSTFPPEVGETEDGDIRARALDWFAVVLNFKVPYEAAIDGSLDDIALDYIETVRDFNLFWFGENLYVSVSEDAEVLEIACIDNIPSHASRKLEERGVILSSPSGVRRKFEEAVEFVWREDL